jgi:hypothetical protein
VPPREEKVRALMGPLWELMVWRRVDGRVDGIEVKLC